MSLSFNENHGVVLWGSESSALTVPFAQAKVFKAQKSSPCGDVEACAGGDSTASTTDRLTCTHRHDLDEDGGEVLEMRVVPCSETLALRMALWTASGCARDTFACPLDTMGGYVCCVYGHGCNGMCTPVLFQPPDKISRFECGHHSQSNPLSHLYQILRTLSDAAQLAPPHIQAASRQDAQHGRFSEARVLHFSGRQCNDAHLSARPRCTRYCRHSAPAF